MGQASFCELNANSDFAIRFLDDNDVGYPFKKLDFFDESDFFELVDFGPDDFSKMRGEFSRLCLTNLAEGFICNLWATMAKSIAGMLVYDEAMKLFFHLEKI